MPIQRWVNSERPFSAQPAKDRWCSRPHLQCANNSIVKTTNNLPLTNVYNVSIFENKTDIEQLFNIVLFNSGYVHWCHLGGHSAADF